MKRIVFTLIALVVGISMSAQSIESLWKEYQKAFADDMPVTALQKLRQIQSIAEQKKQYGDLLLSMFREVEQTLDISNDSCIATRDRLLKKMNQWKAQGNGVMTTLAQTALYKTRFIMPRSYVKGYYADVPRIDSLLASPDAEKYTRKNAISAYNSFIVKGADSKFFNNDLLHVIAMTTQQYEEMQNYYASTSNRKAACIAAALCIEKNDCPRMQKLKEGKVFPYENQYNLNAILYADSLIDIYQDLPECGEIALKKLDKMNYENVRLRYDWLNEILRRWPKWQGINKAKNSLQSITHPYFGADYCNDLYTTLDNVKISGRARNIGRIKITMTREGNSTPITRYFDLPKHEVYEVFTDTLTIGQLPLGSWKVEMMAADGSTSMDRRLINVTNLKVLSVALPKAMRRFVVVNATTGQPVPGAKIEVSKNSSTEKFTTYTTDENGEVTAKVSNSCNVRAYTDEDTACPWSRVWNNFNYSKTDKRKDVERLYTDRAIYQPGQTVHANIVQWQLTDDKDVQVKANEYVKVTLYNAQNKKLESKEVKTDDFGAASLDFVLPKEERNGIWSLRTDDGYYSFRVEEYKRPTFEVKLEKPQTEYHIGDTLLVRGTAKMYSGAPVPNATVVYNVQRHLQWWWRNNEDYNPTLLRDTLTTDADGTFVVRMPMVSPFDENRYGAHSKPYYYNIEATATVTSINGESHDAIVTMPLSNRDTYFATNIPARILADSTVVVKYRRTNMSGTAIEGKVSLTLDGNEIAPAEANKPYALPENIPSGEHKLVAICGTDTLKNAFTVFRKTDTVPMVYTHNWFYQSAEHFSKTTNDAWIQLGTSDENVYAIYNIISGDSILESGHFNMNNDVRARTFIYNKGYGTGILYTVAWIKDGVMYTNSASIARPTPSKELKLKWTTFRDKLVPGQKEQWTMHITNPDGTPAKAQLMAVLYDKSLDMLAKTQWYVPDYRANPLPSTSWNTLTASKIFFQIRHKYEDLDYEPLKFSYISDTFMPNSKRGKLYGVFDCVESQPISVGFSVGGAPTGALMMKEAKANAKLTRANDTEDSAQPTEQQGDAMRTDFSETAFFMPALTTDSNGDATLKFTLPQSVTTWHFKGLAHDKEMKNGLLESDAVAQKQLMIQPNMPRFLRQGDKATISTTVTNMSEKSQNVSVVMTIIDQETEQTVMNATQKVAVKPNNAAAVSFPVDAAKLSDKAYICRVMAESASHKDGEQHLLPVLSDKELITATATYTVYEPKDTTIDISDMIPATAMDITKKVVHVANPAALMTDALNEIKVPDCKNAICLATAIYAGGNCYGELQKLQNADGSITWFPGMSGSIYMTTAVAKILTRHDIIAGHQTAAEPILNRAFSYLQQEMDKRVKYMKEQKKKGYEPWLSFTELDWLYALTISGRDGGESARYLIKLIVEDTKHSDMETKAVAAIVLNANKKKKDAKTYVESIKQHTVMRSDVGRYFDSHRAAYSWCDYRIPTQVMAIEALLAVTPEDSRTITEMRRWLLSSKRTQQWDTPYNTVNAVHAFIGNMSELPKQGTGIITVETKAKNAADSTGTVKIDGTKVSVKAAPKNVNGVQETWTSTFVSYKQKSADVQDMGTGIKVKRSVYLQKKGESTSSASSLEGKVGDKVTVLITVEADRDYDFVTVTDNRAACLEPVQAVSGYRYGCYQEIKDKCTNFYFNMLSKGTHTITAEYYIDRTGNYNSGSATAVCTYAPEFRGTCGNYGVNAKEK